MTTRRRRMTNPGTTQGNTVGIDPHKKTLSACVIDDRGGVLDVAHFKVSGDGHRGLEAWARRHGPVATWGIEGASSLGRHTAIFLIQRGHDVRDVCPNRTNQRGRGRQWHGAELGGGEPRRIRRVLSDGRRDPLAERAQQLGSRLEPVLVEVVARPLPGAEQEVALEIRVLDESFCELVAQVRRCERCAAASASRATGISFSASGEPSTNDTIEPSPK